MRESYQGTTFLTSKIQIATWCHRTAKTRRQTLAGAVASLIFFLFSSTHHEIVRQIWSILIYKSNSMVELSMKNHTQTHQPVSPCSLFNKHIWISFGVVAKRLAWQVMIYFVALMPTTRNFLCYSSKKSRHQKSTCKIILTSFWQMPQWTTSIRIRKKCQKNVEEEKNRTEYRKCFYFDDTIFM